MFSVQNNLPKSPLYDESFEHDACGIGACVSIHGEKTHEIVDDALKIVENLEHRAGQDAEGKTGDGVGIMTQIPHEFFSREMKTLGVDLGGERQYGVGMFFFSQDEKKRNRAKKMFEVIVKKHGLSFLGWRQVPVCENVLGKRALACIPVIMQAFIKKPENCNVGLDFDRKLFVARRIFEQSNEDTYVLSLSSRTIVYKGMFLVGQLRPFFTDLNDAAYKSAIALVHSRFSTNTTPAWERAHPYRFLVHNGEINTIKGNADKMLAREENMQSSHLSENFSDILPVIHSQGSDSAMLDNTIEFLVMSGMPLPLTMMITIPEPWDNNHTMSTKERDFYQYYATMMEPWDGPASILFSDGDILGAILDRNGLRPSRYYVTKDGRLILSSEVGVLNIPEESIVKKDRLRPGKMLVVDTLKGEIVDDSEIKEKYASSKPYGEWLDRHMVLLKELKIPNIRPVKILPEERERLCNAFGYTAEDINEAILPMARDGIEPVASMGIDTPLPVLSKAYHPLFDSFKQLFAQVTNPPIDAIREEIVTSSTVYIGKDGNLLEESPENCTVLKVNNPILSDTDLLKIRHMDKEGFKVANIGTTYYKNTSLKKAIDRLFMEADRAYMNGANIIILSDRDIDEIHVAIPSLLAVSALQQHFVVTKKRTSVAVVIETAEPKNVHDFATLMGYGACAINPYLAHDCIRNLVETDRLNKDIYAAMEDYDNAILHGIVKIASKMGISTIQSYQGSKIFEAIGIDKDVIDEYFTGTVARIGGMDLQTIGRRTDEMHSLAFESELLDESETQIAKKENHLYSRDAVKTLQASVAESDYEKFREYAKLIDDSTAPMNLRGLLQIKFPQKGIPLSKVESEEEIVKHFRTGAISYGAISKEAHETLAIAMNKLGGMSNTGEGGEEDDRATEARSRIRQVASGRFGVTLEFLSGADEIQIKMAQGAKPGEGGHLPAKKVYPWIAKTRHSTPGVALISPPPHHDIYSIEDLSELIFDLKNANTNANISVKLVSEAGVGTIAAGVAKAGAQVVLISGYDGGTGAATKSSISNAGLPWELGLAEAHQTLIMNGLRDKVKLEVDGKLMTGRDVLIAAILGAEEFSFSTAPMVCMGCIMCRSCHKDICPAGIATQNPELRKRFKGTPKAVEEYMLFVARQVREYMAKLGIAKLKDLVGRSDLLFERENGDDAFPSIDLSPIITPGFTGAKAVFNKQKVYDFKLEKSSDVTKLVPMLKKGAPNTKKLSVNNTQRSFGTIFGAEMIKQDKKADYVVEAKGGGGQSFGAFIPAGLTISLTGDANDYFGKGLSGGKLILKAPKNAGYDTSENIIVGNVALYGATAGEAYIAGIAGERFAVRNSGVRAVVEGVGDHGCEYMTGGRVVVLGSVGKNFAAGMSGGIAYVYDPYNDLYTKLNKEMVSFDEITSKYDVFELKGMVEDHFKYTGSLKAKMIAENFSEYLPHFKKIIPKDYEKMLHLIAQMEEKGFDEESAKVEAFFQSVK